MTDQPNPTDQPPPPEWLEALARSEADLAACRTVSGESVMRRLRQTIAEMEAQASGDPAREAARHR